jgi:DNA repair protein RecO (recombination protein O)
MSRTATYSALVLRNRLSGESNSEVTLLTAEEGIIKTTVFGGPKSKLRSHSAPYNSGKVWIYRDPAKNYRKLSDFDVDSWRPGLRELYERTMAASAVIETVLSTHGGGSNWEIALELAISVLNALENANEELCSRLFVHFLWRWVAFLGIQHHLECCIMCGKEGNSTLWYSISESTVLCEACQTHHSQTNSQLIKLNSGSCRWLTVTGQIEPAFLHRYSTDNKSFSEIKALTTAVLAETLGKRLVSWDW